MQTTESVISQEAIARRAYEIWQERGCPPGDGQENWQAAEAELMQSRVRRNSSTQRRAQSWWSRVRHKLVGQD
jgi:hypothetical protein